MKETTGPSLKLTFRKFSIKWALVGFVLTLALTLPCFFYFSKRAAENRIAILAESVTRAFRPQILEGNLRDSQFQMRRVLNLQQGEHLVIRNPNFRVIYAPEPYEYPPACLQPQKACFNFFSGDVTYLQPVYFNEDRKDSLYGFVELKINNPIEWGVILVFLVFLIAIFSALTIGLLSTQFKSVRLITDTLKQWTKHLKESPSSPSPSQKAPFEEFLQLEEAISSLHVEIERLKQKAAEDAKAKAQLSLLREISHDLKTPFSQLSKFFAVHLSKSKRTGIVDWELTQEIQRSLDRTGDLIRHVQTLSPTFQSQPVVAFTDLTKEAEQFVTDLAKEPDFKDRRISVKFEMDLKAKDSLFAKIPKLQFYRILDNLLRNALDAVRPETGEIVVKVLESDERPTLIVQDNGCGIEPAHMKKIFDADYSTKPARGTGLGLSIVKKLCTDFAAEIKVFSGIQNTIFKIVFQPFDFREDLHEVSHISG